MSEIEVTLEEREKTYGDFLYQAHITQGLKDAMRSAVNWESLQDDMRESLDMICGKMARILNGNPYYHDSWHDIVGYAKLVADRLEVTSEKTT